MFAATDLSGARKSALLLVQLGPERAAKVLQSLDDQEIEAVIGEVACLEGVTDDLLTAVLTEFVDHVGRPGRVMRSGSVLALSMLTSGLGAERASQLIERIGAPPFGAVADLHPDQGAAVLCAEHPQTAALVLCALGPERALQLLRRLPAERQGDVAYRMATMDPPPAATLAQVDAALSRRIASSATEPRPRRERDRTDVLVALLTRADAELEAAILDEITRLDAALATHLRGQLFAFADLVKLDDKAIQLLLREVDTGTLALALKGAGDNVRSKIFDNLSERASANLSEEIDLLGPQRKADVDSSRREVLATMRRLEEAGTITVTRGSESYVE